MQKSPKIIRSEQGFILIFTLLTLVVLTLIGISATRTSNIELKVAGNEKWSQESFYQADGASESATMVIEESIANAGMDNNDYYGVYVRNLNFYMKELDALCMQNDCTVHAALSSNLDWSFNGQAHEGSPSPPNPDTRVDMYMPRDVVGPTGPTGPPYTRLKMAADTHLTPGASPDMAFGYHAGTSAADRGSYMLYDIWANNLGRNNSETLLRLQYRHIN